jgi:DNA-binding CsgD family transcriptional regulator
VLRLFADGFSHKAAGVRLGLSSETIKSHSRSFRAKMGARTTVHAVAIGLRAGVIR